MTIRALLLLLVSVGWWRLPAATHAGRETARRAAAIVVALMVVLALSADPLLELLDIDAETFRIATGLVLCVAGAARMLGAGTRVEDYSGRLAWVVPLAYPVLIGPETVLAAISVGADHGVLVVTLVALAAATLTLFSSIVVVPRLIGTLLVRAGGVALVVLGVALVFDGLRAI